MTKSRNNNFEVSHGLPFLGMLTRLFMKAGPEVIAAAPEIFRLFSIVYLFLGTTVVCDYYFQSVMQEKASMVVGFMHSIQLITIILLSRHGVKKQKAGLEGVPMAGRKPKPTAVKKHTANLLF